MKITLNILLLFVLFQSSAQNLVPNPSFEDTVSCPYGANSNLSVATWFNPSIASPDYYNICSNSNNNGVPDNMWGYQEAKDGNAYAGFLTFYNSISNYREYWEVQLTNPLTAGTNYYWSFWVSRLDETDYASNNIGIHFSDTIITSIDDQVFNVPPAYNYATIVNDSINWLQISGVYVAAGGEQYIVIGNFYDDLQTTNIQVQAGSNGGEGACYYLDDVCISTDSATCIGNVGLSEFNSSEKKLVRIVDTMGRETEDKPNTLLIYVYSNGTKEKVFRVE